MHATFIGLQLSFLESRNAGGWNLVLHRNVSSHSTESFRQVSYKNGELMRKIIVLSMITLNGVMQGPGGPKEDPSGGFKYGGWMAPYDDDVYDKVVRKELEPAEYLLGRKTFEMWAGYWPDHGNFWPGINEGTKYVFSKRLKKSDPLVTGWKNSVVLRTVADIKKVRQSKGSDIQVWGSSELVHLLLKNDLVDELRLKIHPLTLGKGKKLFDTGAIPAAFTLIESIVTTRGVIIANYKRAGKVKTGTMGV
jgi:dihydrofolate reductase